MLKCGECGKKVEQDSLYWGANFSEKATVPSAEVIFLIADPLIGSHLQWCDVGDNVDIAIL